MKTLLTITHVLFTFISYGQDTTYYDKNDSQVKNINEANYFTITPGQPHLKTPKFVPVIRI